MRTVKDYLNETQLEGLHKQFLYEAEAAFSDSLAEPFDPRAVEALMDGDIGLTFKLTIDIPTALRAIATP